MKRLRVLSMLMLASMSMPFMTSCSESAQMERAAKEQMEQPLKKWQEILPVSICLI